MTLIAPDWAAIDETIQCPLCAYNLRGLSQPRCPECGYRFEWDEVLDPTKRLHPYLFEHHPERNVDAFFKTLINGFRPRAFWTSLHPVQPSFPRRIILYWLIGTPLLTASGMTCLLLFAHAIATQNAPLRPSFEASPQSFNSAFSLEKAISEHGSMQRYYDFEMPTKMLGVVRSYLVKYSPLFVVPALPYAVPLAWPWFTFACVLVFSQSMSRVRVDRVHVLRCVIYSFDVAFWIGLADLAFIALHLFVYGSERLLLV